MFYALRRAPARVGWFVFIVIFLRGFCVLNKKAAGLRGAYGNPPHNVFNCVFLFGFMFVNRAKNNGQQCQGGSADFSKNILAQSADTAQNAANGCQCNN